MKKLLIIIFLFALVKNQLIFALANSSSLTVRVAASDLIARINIKSTRKKISKDSIYKYIALGEILEIIKGKHDSNAFELEFDNGFACPNVRYTKGDDCLIFAVKMANGRYYTYNSSDGKYNTANNDLYIKKKKEIIKVFDKTANWSSLVKGIRSLLVPTKYTYHLKEKINLYFLFNNISKNSISFKYKIILDNNYTYWELHVTAINSTEVKQINHHSFTIICPLRGQSGKEYTIKINPGYINYKIIGWINLNREKGDPYYYFNKPGIYSISAHAYNLYGDNILKTEKINIEIKDEEK